MTRRGNNDAAIYQRSSDGRWMGVATVGLDPPDGQFDGSVSAKTRAEIARKRNALSYLNDHDLITAEKAPTLESLFDRWFTDVMVRSSGVAAFSCLGMMTLRYGYWSSLPRMVGPSVTKQPIESTC